jgi:hypothetical protein
MHFLLPEQRFSYPVDISAAGITAYEMRTRNEMQLLPEEDEDPVVQVEDIENFIKWVEENKNKGGAVSTNQSSLGNLMMASRCAFFPA